MENTSAVSSFFQDNSQSLAHESCASGWNSSAAPPTLARMNTLETDAEVGADGSMKLLSPLPAWLKPGRAHVLLVVTDAEGGVPAKKRQRPAATPEMLARRKAAYAGLRALGGLGDAIPDPVAWQREIREDRTLPGRE